MQKVVNFTNREDLKTIKQIVEKIQKKYPNVTYHQVNIANLTALLLPNEALPMLIEENGKVNLVISAARPDQVSWEKHLKDQQNGICVDIMSNNEVNGLAYLKAKKIENFMRSSNDRYADYKLNISESERLANTLFFNVRNNPEAKRSEIYDRHELPHEYVVTSNETEKAIAEFRKLLAPISDRLCFPNDPRLQTQVYQLIFPRFRQPVIIEAENARPALILPDGCQNIADVMNFLKSLDGNYVMEHFDDQYQKVNIPDVIHETLKIAQGKHQFVLPFSFDPHPEHREPMILREKHHKKNAYVFDTFIN